jgi:uncharacterized protein YneF (UPF0154 family)
MQYTVELLELWWACLTAAMKDRSLAFPISLVLGALIGGLFWWLAAMSARLWNRRYYLKTGLQILCGIAALLAVVFAVTFASSKNMEDAVKIRLQQWKEAALSDSDWQDECFSEAWDAVAELGHEADVHLSPSPRTDKSLRLLSMGHPESRSAVARTYASMSLHRFEKDRPYLASILTPSGEIPKDRIDTSMIGWFRENAGQPYPLEQGVIVAVGMLEDGAKQQTEAVAAYTRRLSLALFLITQLIVFITIGYFAHRANRPASAPRA